MIYILSGTNRPQSRSLEVSKIVQKMYKDIGQDSKIVPLCELPLSELSGSHYAEEKPKAISDRIDELMQAEGLVVICPEYNGSMPGALKYFIDHWKYPESFEHRPVCFIGLGGMFGGLRPVEHLQQIFGYRNAFIYPDRIFLINVWGELKDGEITNDITRDLMEKQAQGFCRFIKALKSENLHGGDYKS